MQIVAFLCLQSLLEASVAADAYAQMCSFGDGVPPPPQMSNILAANYTCSAGSATPSSERAKVLNTTLFRASVPSTGYVDVRSITYDRATRKPMANDNKVHVGLITSKDGWNKLDLNATVAALHAMAKAGPLDLVTLEEEHNCHTFSKASCCDGGSCEIDGEYVTTLAAVAKQHRFWLVVPMRLQQGDHRTNSALVIDREGNIRTSNAGHTSYDKVYPVLGTPTSFRESGLVPGGKGVQTWDTDFGRIAVLICFDINYFELWHEAAALGAEIILWPTAMATPDRDMISLARTFRVNIVGCGHPGDVVESTGEAVPQTVVESGEAISRTAVLDLDKVWIHQDNNCKQLKQLMSDHAGKVELQRACCHLPGPSPTPPGEATNNAIGLLRSVTPGVSARKLCEEYKIESSREYMLRSRQGLNGLRQYAQPIP